MAEISLPALIAQVWEDASCAGYNECDEDPELRQVYCAALRRAAELECRVARLTAADSALWALKAQIRDDPCSLFADQLPKHGRLGPRC